MHTTPPRLRARLPAALGLGLAALLTVLAACIELDGQRIAWFHDVERDELRLLLFYDGIHDSKAGKSGGEQAPEAKSPGQIREFVEHGAYMLLDWPFAVDPVKFNRKAAMLTDEDDEVSEMLWQGLDLMNSVHVETLGWYREPDGRVGAVQRLVIPELSRFVADVNALIDGFWQIEGISYSAKETERLCREAARAGYEWVAFDGQALQLRAPSNADEFARLKRKDIEDLAAKFVRYAEQEGGLEAIRPMLQRVGHSLGGIPFSLIDEGDLVTLRIGYRDVPLQIDLALRSEYEPSMEAVVQEAVALDLDALLAAHLLAGADADADAGQADALDDLATWGPPEERVRALLARVAPADGAPGDAAAWEALKQVAVEWNTAHRQPFMPLIPGPLQPGAAERARSAWETWYAQRRGLPAEN